jgi:hypothetical protein
VSTATPHAIPVSSHPCGACGTWACSACGGYRPLASRFSRSPQRCPRCDSAKGAMLPTRHQESRALDHDESLANLVAAGA